MNHKEFMEAAVLAVCEWTNRHIDKTDGVQVKVEDVYVVWSVKVLQNSKALLSTTNPDGMYFEATLNGNKNEIYLDAYKKFDNLTLTEG